MLRRPGALAALLGATWVLFVVLQLHSGPADFPAGASPLRGAFAAFGLAAPLDDKFQVIAELRLCRALTSGTCGASLALAGALLQGLFRNGLAAPTVIGVNAGASLGAAGAILLLGGYGPAWLQITAAAPFLIPIGALVGALGISALVIGVASIGGRISVPTLLLTGIAVNASVAGILAAIQSTVMEDWEVARALLSFTFGSFDDRQGQHVAMGLAGLLLSLAVVPFVASELDLFAAGEDDAMLLGVDVPRTKALALGASALATACAVAAVGQIGFIGLIVPHVLRMVVGVSHRWLLWLCPLGGAVFLTGTDLAQRAWFGDFRLQPGVVMALIGGPFFLLLLLRNRRIVSGW